MHFHTRYIENDLWPLDSKERQSSYRKKVRAKWNDYLFGYGYAQDFSRPLYYGKLHGIDIRNYGMNAITNTMRVLGTKQDCA